jgi:hypothetical protein
MRRNKLTFDKLVETRLNNGLLWSGRDTLCAIHDAVGRLNGWMRMQILGASSPGRRNIRPRKIRLMILPGGG